ncbi:MAG: helix-turn-helix transcriptional regulator [Desulfamplus sp.]|nr:helix-turn-helix transcriptional regulator [Desulfamplus sp.]
MDSIEFKKTRAAFGKTQKQMAQILGTSIKAIHSYEQGWRKIPHHVERQLLFILAKLNRKGSSPATNCWDVNQCPDDIRIKCPAWEFYSGDMCWFINGTICSGKVHKNWKEKIETCRCCTVFHQFFNIEKQNCLDDED